MRDFISYSHQQQDWVLGSLCPILEAARVEVIVDRDLMRAGHPTIGKMGAVQDEAEATARCVYCKDDKAMK